MVRGIRTPDSGEILICTTLSVQVNGGEERCMSKLNLFLAGIVEYVLVTATAFQLQTHRRGEKNCPR